MGNHFYHIRWPPLNVTIFITHVRHCVIRATPMFLQLQTAKWCIFAFKTPAPKWLRLMFVSNCCSHCVWGFCIWSFFCSYISTTVLNCYNTKLFFWGGGGAVRSVLFSFAIISMRKRELVVLLKLSSWCLHYGSRGPWGAVGWSAVGDYGTSWSFILTNRDGSAV